MEEEEEEDPCWISVDAAHLFNGNGVMNLRIIMHIGNRHTPFELCKYTVIQGRKRTKNNCCQLSWKSSMYHDCHTVSQY